MSGEKSDELIHWVNGLNSTCGSKAVKNTSKWASEVRHWMGGQWKKDGERKKIVREWSESREAQEEPLVTKVDTLAFSPCVQVLQPVHSRL